jgi:predicted O-methyltransferase YrrM
MKLELVREIVGKTPHMSFEQAQKMSQFLQDHKLRDILELGFRYGVSTCYMAATLQEMGSGHITTIDLEVVRAQNPNVKQLLGECQLTSYVDIFFEPTSYVWRLMKFLEEDPSPRYDFCYLDGAHDWFVDGFAFFLIDRLLRPGGWIIFDDLDWTYAQSPTLRNSPKVKSMPVDEQVTPQVRKVYELLVKTHPEYSDFMTDGEWAYAHKASDVLSRNRSIVREVVVQKEEIGFGAALLRMYRKLRNYT